MNGAADAVVSGPLLVALLVSAVAGLVSFLSPCVLPLVPGYLGYVTGLTGADLAGARRGRVLAGSLLFVLGFAVVFVLLGFAAGGLGGTLIRHQRAIQVVLGLMTVVLGLSFAGVLPGFQRELKPHLRPAPGLLGAPLLGVVFAIGWAPCVGPTLTAITSLAFVEGGAARGGWLAFAYALGLGLPFVLAAVAFRRAMGAFAAVKRHHLAVMRVGGGFLVVIGLLLVTGLWGDAMARLQVWTLQRGVLV